MEALRLYNTLTRTKAHFAPIDASNVRFYVCGPTVYDFAHIGNARPVIVFDTLFRILRHIYGDEHVTYTRNITDIDDKINQRAFERNISIRELTEQTAQQFHEDIAALGTLMPVDVNKIGEPARFIEPRATEHIEDMKYIIELLKERGIAYVAHEHVLFSVKSMEEYRTAQCLDKNLPRYGSLAKRTLDEMLMGARVEVAPYKKDAMDFVLWKPSKDHEPSWPSPCGITTNGRPGWHIECSAMSWRHLVKNFEERLKTHDPSLTHTFDIHAGGIDLVFPHHENEIAQSCCAFDSAKMANVWLHNGFLMVEGEKMSKSLGNFITIHQLLKTQDFGARSWQGETLRLAMLKTHYRQPIDWTVKALEEAEKTLKQWYARVGDIELNHAELAKSVCPNVFEALCDDLNTPKAFAALHQIDDPATLKASAQLMGLLKHTASQWNNEAHSRSQQQSEVDIPAIETLLEARSHARTAHNWAESDRIRDELLAMGIKIKDNKNAPTSWEIVQ